MSGKRVVCWLRNDLRVLDNDVLDRGAQEVKAGRASEVIPFYCFDPRFFGPSAWNTAKTGPFRAQFQLESVLDLKTRLRNLGSDLLIAVGKPEEVLPQLLNERSNLVLTQEEVTYEELQVDKKVRAAIQGRGQMELIWGSTLFHKADLPFRGDLGDMPDVFTPFKEKCEKRSSVRKELPVIAPKALPLPKDAAAGKFTLDFTPTWADLPFNGPKVAPPGPEARGVLPFKGGETEALKRLKYYLWDSDLIANYFNSRNGMIGGDYSTKFAPWLAHGCLSPRTIYHEIAKYEAQRPQNKNKSTYWVIFELIWRDFYKYFALKHGSAIFFEEGTSGSVVHWSKDPELLQRWKEGRTGMPLVDANMRELAATGFMSNRGRQNVASYLALDLGLDWRLGADHFESLLLDYDVASNWGNWVAAAGLTGGRVNHFNISKQASDYDKDGDYVRLWLPELRNVPASKVHQPWLMSKEDQKNFGCQIGVDYPNPIPASRMNKRDYGASDSGSYRGGRGGSGGRGGRGGDRDRRDRGGGGGQRRY